MLQPFLWQVRSVADVSHWPPLLRAPYVVISPMHPWDTVLKKGHNNEMTCLAWSRILVFSKSKVWKHDSPWRTTDLAFGFNQLMCWHIHLHSGLLFTRSSVHLCNSWTWMVGCICVGVSCPAAERYLHGQLTQLNVKVFWWWLPVFSCSPACSRAVSRRPGLPGVSGDGRARGCCWWFPALAYTYPCQCGFQKGLTCPRRSHPTGCWWRAFS